MLLFGLLCVGGEGRAQPLLEHFGRAHGLPSDYVLALAQSRAGYLWIGTDAGLVRYDGARFQTFTPDDGLPHAYVANLAEGRGDTLWVGTNGGLVFFADGRLHAPAEMPGGASVADIVADALGHVAVAHGGGMALRDPSGRWHEYASPCPAPFYALRGTLRLYPDGTVEGRCQDNGSRFVLPAGASSSLHNPQSPRGTAADALGQLLHNDVVRYALDARDGTRYAASRLGLFTLAPTPSTVWTGHVEALMEDYEGSVWFGTFGQGLYRVRSRALAQLSGGTALRLARGADGRLWATGDTLVVLDPATRQVQHFPSVLRTRAAVVEASGVPYLSASTLVRRVGSLARYAAQPRVTEMPGWVSGLAFQGDTLVVSSYGNGVIRLLNDQPLDTLGVGNGLPTGTIEDVACFSSGCWLFTRSHGVLRLRGNRIRRFGRAEGLPSSTTFCAYQARDGTVWIGTDQGLARIVGEHVEPVVGRALENQRVVALVERAAAPGVLWAVTDGGLVRVDGRGALRRSPQPLALPGASLNAAFYDAPTDQLFLATTEGVMAVRMADVVTQTLPAPRVALYQVEVDGQVPSPSSDVLRLPRAHARLVVEAALLSFAGPARGEYRLDRGPWRTMGEGRSVAFPRLAPGHYTLEMRAVNVEGKGSQAPARLRFYVPPLWWQRPWVMVLMGLLAMAAAGLTMRAAAARRLRHLQMEHRFQREREHLSRDLHDYVGGQLATLVTAAELVELSARKGDAAQMAAHAEAAGVAARQTLFQVRQTVHTLRSTALSARELYEQVQHQAQAQLRFVSRPALTAQFSATPGAEPDVQKLDAPAALQVLRIAQEALTNVVRHAQAQSVELHVLAEAGVLVLKIEDDGVGLDGQPRGNGRTIMHHRAAEIGASLALGPGRSGRGTRLVLHVPLTARNR